jgi:predicted O-methyltransferase YrrM
MKSLLHKIRNRIFAGIARQSDIDRLYNQVFGLQQIQNAMTGGPILRPMRGWAMSPDAMAWILTDLYERESPNIIEFGSGQSTVIFASLIKNKGSGHLISVEHDHTYAMTIHRQLVSCGLDDVVEFKILELEESRPSPGMPICHSYIVDRLPDITVDVALIDGPPTNHGLMTRYIPLEWALEHLATGGSVYLDDSDRQAEQKVLVQLQASNPHITIRHLPSEKGLCLIKRNLE